MTVISHRTQDEKLIEERGLAIGGKEKRELRLLLTGISTLPYFFFLVGYVEERLWWPIQSPIIGGKNKASS